MDDAPVECAQRLKLHGVAPAADFFGSVLRLFHERVARLGAVSGDVHHDFGRVRVLLEEQAVRDVLQVGEGLALAADKAARIVGFDVEEDAFIHPMFLDADVEAEELKDFFQGGFGFGRHRLVES